MKLLIILCMLASPITPHVISLEITRAVNQWYRETGDVVRYAEIVNGGYVDLDVLYERSA